MPVSRPHQGCRVSTITAEGQESGLRPVQESQTAQYVNKAPGLQGVLTVPSDSTYEM